MSRHTIYNAVLLAEENKQLRTVNKRQKKKQVKRRAYIATRGILTVREGLNRTQVSNKESKRGVADRPAIIQACAPLIYSIYRLLEHTTRICLQKHISN